MLMKAWLGGLGAVALTAALGLAFMPQEAPPAPAAGAPSPSLGPLPLRLPLPLRVTTARAEPPPAAPRAAGDPVAGAELARLVAAARQGDRRAAYVAYQILASCSAMAPPDVCRGLPPSLVQERLRFLADAARAGVVQAQIDFFMEGPSAQQSGDDEALLAWRQQAMGLLTSAAAQCESFAMGLLATLYDAGEVTPRDAAQALAYAVADGQLRHRPPSDDALRDRLAEPVDDATLAVARQQGQRLAAACR